MLYKTHKAGGMAAMLGSVLLMRHLNLYTADIHELVQIGVMYPACNFGSMFPDLDHHWHSIKEKTPLNWVVNKGILMTGAKHRSKQTHSLDLFLVCVALLYLMFYKWDLWGVIPSRVEFVIARLWIAGFLSGLASHLFLDLLTPDGIWAFFGRFKIRLVWKSKSFATGGTWETIVHYLCILCSLVLLGFVVYGGIGRW